MAAVMQRQEAVSQQENDENQQPANIVAAYPVEALQVRNSCQLRSPHDKSRDEYCHDIL